MGYKTEMHCHSREVSRCGYNEAKETVEHYLSLGYTTLVLTNHFSAPTFEGKRAGPLYANDWDLKVTFFMNGYNKMLEVSDGRLNILLGCEARPTGVGCDIHIYGITEEWLRSHPNFLDYKMDKLYAEVDEAGMLLIQAHPFRDGCKIISPKRLHGYETFNGNLGHENRNEIARIWAEKYDYIQTSGTDTHIIKWDVKQRAGIITEEPIITNEQLVEVLKSRQYELIRYGDLPY